jgi:hypothetical protein
MLTACDQSVNVHRPIVNASTFLVTYDKEPFGNKQFHAFVQMMGPLWDDLKESHPDLELFRYVVPSDLSDAQATAQLEKTLGSNWKVDSAHTQQSHWGWSRGYRNDNYILVFLTINSEHADNSIQPSLLPAAILTDANYIY